MNILAGPHATLNKVRVLMVKRVKWLLRKQLAVSGTLFFCSSVHTVSPSVFIPNEWAPLPFGENKVKKEGKELDEKFYGCHFGKVLNTLTGVVDIPSLLARETEA